MELSSHLLQWRKNHPQNRSNGWKTLDKLEVLKTYKQSSPKNDPNLGIDHKDLYDQDKGAYVYPKSNVGSPVPTIGSI